MEIVYSSKALEHLQWWKASGNKKIQEKISKLIADIKLHPETGLGKPEMLKHDFSGYYFRRINAEHRLVYKIEEGTVAIASLKGHYT